MKSIRCLNILIPVFLIFVSGCALNSIQKTGANSEKPNVFYAFYSEQTVNVDGLLDEPIWTKAKAYPLHLSKDKTDAGEELIEAGEVRFAWDDNFFYLASTFYDSDIVAEGKEDQLHHYRYGDLCEMFLKPADENYYWELYVTPAGNKTSFFFPSRGYLGLPSCFEDYRSDLKVAAKCNGTLNSWQDKDNSWTAEMAMPVKDLQAYGAKFSPQANWKILIGRYNYSVHLENVELSMTPQISQTSFHLYEQYADLKLLGK